MKKLLIVSIASIVCAIVCVTVKTDLNAVACSLYASFSPTTYDFGSVPVGDTSGETTVTITIGDNGACGGGETWTGFNLSLTGANADQFDLISDTCPSTVSSGSTCTATLAFSPTASGNYTDAALQVDSSSDSMDLSGTGTEAGAESGSSAILLSLLNNDDSDGCNATASTGAAGRRGFGPAALGLVALMGLVLGTAAVRRRMRKR
ncbi:MAG: choice-of-anchor D domain-containing protein [Spirochaetes bacterium]|nr:choice-of-anchor D domain-containing protein [Spirochaetota bacterium]